MKFDLAVAAVTENPARPPQPRTAGRRTLKNNPARVALDPMAFLSQTDEIATLFGFNPPATRTIKTMSHQSIFCITNSHFQANHIVDQLKIAKVPDDEISTLLADRTATREFVNGVDLGATKTITTIVNTGALLGATWGWIAGINAMAIPGAGLFLAGGPIIAAMSAATLGAALGGICGGLIRMGVPEIEAKRYEGNILKGKILLSVNQCDSTALNRVKDVFDQAEASDICSIAVSKPSRQSHRLHRGHH